MIFGYGEIHIFPLQSLICMAFLGRLHKIITLYFNGSMGFDHLNGACNIPSFACAAPQVIVLCPLVSLQFVNLSLFRPQVFSARPSLASIRILFD